MRHFLWLLLLVSQVAYSQPVNQPNGAQIKLRLKKLNVLGSVLYVAAHPDDENTRVITTFANDKLFTTAYLSLTRGDGGQNLIGPEIRDLLGVIRTQELLMARKIDGGQQFFTRANDFGYSKSAQETIEIWGKDEILSDVVKVFREFQPDVIITRFPADERAGHGHHTSSAIFAQEAFDVSGDVKYKPEEVKAIGTWQPKRLYTNTGRWWNRDINENTQGVISLDVGAYNALLGKSYAEIAALSSSQHKSQGWGRAGERGKFLEFFEYVKGDRAQTDLFEGINTSWTRVKGGDKIEAHINQIILDFNEEDPAASVPALVALRKSIIALDNSVWKKRKLDETERLIVDCLGLFAEVTAAQVQGSPGETTTVSVEITNRSKHPVRVQRIQATNLAWDSTLNKALTANEKLQFRSKGIIDQKMDYTEPYWLREEHGTGRFAVKSNELIGTAENAAALSFRFSLLVGNESLELIRPVIYKWVDPVKGELWRPYEIVPAITVSISDRVMILGGPGQRSIKALITSNVDRKISGQIKLALPAGWACEPKAQPFELEKRGHEVVRSFNIMPSSAESTGEVKAIATADGRTFDEAVRLISYDHIPVQTILQDASVRVVRTDLKKKGQLIGYVRGAGDDIPSALRNIGYEVWEMKDEEITIENLHRVDAVVVGIRALNTNERIKYFMAELLRYVEEGGTMVVQYNTSHDVEVETFSPYPITLSRDRVTQEDSEVKILKPEHPLFNVPNKITVKDFDGWVQERGLYFPNKWDAQFTPLLSMNDKREPAKEGSLLVAQHGAGYYIYTGLSFFRQLPEGVPGAYKLFANIVSLASEKKTQSARPKSKTR